MGAIDIEVPRKHMLMKREQICLSSYMVPMETCYVA